MRPNIVVMVSPFVLFRSSANAIKGAYNLEAYRNTQPLIDLSGEDNKISEHSLGPSHEVQIPQTDKRKQSKGQLPTDTCRIEGPVNVKNYVTILEDLLLKLQINVAVAKGFKDLEFPQKKGQNTRKYIDLWPIQMSAQIAADGEDSKQKLLTTNFDTYTLILQLGCILDTVPTWKKAYKLRVAVFVEDEIDVEEERSRVQTLLDNLRIQAEILVFWLASGKLKTYQIVIHGDVNGAGQEAEKSVDETLKDEDWWQDLQKLRGRRGDITASEDLVDTRSLLNNVPSWPSSSFQQGRGNSPARRLESLRKLVRKSRRRRSSGDLNGMGLSMQTHRLHDHVLHRHASHASASEDEEPSSDATDFEVFESDSEGPPDDPRPMGEFEEVHNNGNPLAHSTPRASGRPAHSNSQHESLRRAQSTNPRSSGNPSPTVTLDDSNILTASDRNRPQIPQSCPRPSHQSSAAKFSSRPQPKATVNTEDGRGPSIMFSDSPPTPPKHSPSIYTHPSATPATGLLSSQSTPLSFNDLRCRAQHLVLNELMQQHSKNTAVLFTTLPSPIEGTCENEEDCVSYLSDLEVLWNGLPPVLLVHSNSMTVTMNL